MKINSVYSYDLSGKGLAVKDSRVQNRIPYTGDDLNDDNSEKKEKFSVKKATNAAAVAAWLLVAGLGIYRTGIFRPRSTKGVLNKATKELKKIKNEKNALKYSDDIDEILKGQSKGTQKRAKLLYKLGSFFHDTENKMGKELFNNVTYAIGTLFVMPLVIWTSPFGKKDSSTSDKAYATLRQPFSVAATFTLQAMFDKLADKFIPNIINNNTFEIEDIKNNGLKNKDNLVVAKLYDKIKYNVGEAKRIFTNVLTDISPEDGGLKGILSKEEAEKILDIGCAPADEINSYKRNYEKVIKSLREARKATNNPLNEDMLAKIGEKHKVIQNVVGYNNLLKTRPKVLNNVIVSSVIGCTVLNVVYGKTMKFIEKKRVQKAEGGKETV